LKNLPGSFDLRLSTISNFYRIKKILIYFQTLIPVVNSAVVIGVFVAVKATKEHPRLLGMSEVKIEPSMPDLVTRVQPTAPPSVLSWS